jgi:hypothetical protein
MLESMVLIYNNDFKELQIVTKEQVTINSLRFITFLGLERKELSSVSVYSF